MEKLDHLRVVESFRTYKIFEPGSYDEYERYIAICTPVYIAICKRCALLMQQRVPSL